MFQRETQQGYIKDDKKCDLHANSQHLPIKDGTHGHHSFEKPHGAAQETCAADAIAPRPQVGQNRDRCSPVGWDWSL